MDIWVLDRTLEANDIVDTFNSLIWTDRYDEYGDFVLNAYDATSPYGFTVRTVTCTS